MSGNTVAKPMWEIGSATDELLDAGQMERRAKDGSLRQIDVAIGVFGGRNSHVQPALDEPGKFRMPNLIAVAAGKNHAKRREWTAAQEFANRVHHALQFNSFPGLEKRLEPCIWTCPFPYFRAATLQKLMRHQDIKTTLKYYVAQNADDVAEQLYSAWDRSSVPLANG